MKPLRQKMIEDMKLRRLADSTKELYVAAVADLAKHYNQSPDLLDKEQLQKYLLYLMEERQLAWSTCNVAVAGMRFFYTQTLGWDAMQLGIPSMRSKSKLPEILSHCATRECSTLCCLSDLALLWLAGLSESVSMPALKKIHCKLTLF